MDKLTTRQKVKEFADLYPYMNASEISAYFTVSRQRIYLLMNEIYTKEELKARKRKSKKELASKIKEKLQNNTTQVKIVKDLNISDRTYYKIINSELSSFVNENKVDKEKRISDISFDFKSGMSFFELRLKYNLGNSSNCCSGIINSYRKKYGEEMFPRRQIKRSV